ncbi:MAG: SDR family oxidoreductase [Lentisphaerae bacterium]|jgi:NAD(P)-dependent dehydrogenase (short-subunit alcohol dehydrogenase family)|nr:SDR family oxidoreductase [Lentisphaerota bacterium]
MKLPFKVDLNGKTAVVTGGSGVLCSVMAKALAACGASVAVMARRAESVEKIAAEIMSEGGVAKGFSCDVMDRDRLEEVEKEIVSEFGGIDILINGAGGNHPKGTTTKEYLFPEDLSAIDPNITTFFDLDPEGVQFVFNLNFLGTLLPTQVFLKTMVQKGSGVVINVSSMNAFTPLTKIPAYSGAKAAVSNFTQWLAVHMSKAGVRVNAIAPGFFVTDQNRALMMNPDGTPTERGGKVLSNTPLSRFGSPEELIGALLWLADDKSSSFVTGTVIPVDGGFSAYSGV